ncbi:MAG TPA: ATP-binding protein, partial [Candidatus Polarisedimenticolia bacterium]|nr:ATP-binding protein [Candidatus Polarisedimenticolia bacterium]
MASLVFSDSTGRQVVYPLDKETVSIGRSVENDIVSADLRVSRRHATLVREAEGSTFTIRDEASSRGVFVNQRRVKEAKLRDGDIIGLGDSVYSFVEIPSSSLQGIAPGRGPSSQTPSSAELRGGALVADVQEAAAQLRTTLQDTTTPREALETRLGQVETRLESLRQHLIRLERSRLMMETLHEVGQIINSSWDRENLLEIILDLAVKVVRAERGFLTLFDGESGTFTRRAAINMGSAAGSGDGPASDRDFSTGIALSVARSGDPIVTTDAQLDDRFKERRSVVDLNIHSALCVPLVDRARKIMGVIYVDTRVSVVLLGPEDREFLTAFATYAAIAIENASLLAQAAERARMEEELRQARKMDEMKSNLISIVSHDVRTPLTSIKSYAEILYDDLESLEPARQRHFLDIINREADRLARLVTNYLDLQKIEAGMMRLSPAPMEVAKFVEESLEAFQGAAREKGVALSRQMEPSLPVLRGDRDRLLQVLANLMSNAIKFTPPGGAVTVTARSTLLTGRGPALEIGVRDTGEGIPPDKIEKLFKRFSQVGEQRSGPGGGTGLGLVFAREIVELHGGRIDVS